MEIPLTHLLALCSAFLLNYPKTFLSLPATKLPAYQPRATTLKLDLINVEIGTVRKLLMLQRSSAAGPDGIPGLFYRKLAGVLAQPLTTVFQHSLYQRAIPDMWQNALVILLFKGKDSKTSATPIVQ